MSKTSIPERTRLLLWGKAAGRCQYEGCNKELYKDGLTNYEFNSAYVAHIVADSAKGPRGDEILSEQLKEDISNIMLLCDNHHRLIDKVDVEGHTVERLKEMKKKHEDRIKLLTSIDINKQTNIVIYKAKIGNNDALVNYNRAVEAIIPEWYPADSHEIDLSSNNSFFKDNNEFYWELESKHLEGLFNEKIKNRLSYNAQHYSLFAIAPQPLLIKLGSLMSDINQAEVYQLHREPSTWKWQNNDEEFDYKIYNNRKESNTVALNISLSADIDNTRIEDVLSKDISIWTITTDCECHNDFLKSKEQLVKFRKLFRKLLNDIKLSNPNYNEINIFPAMPVAIAVEIGRVWMPKADLSLRIYDENRELGGFVHALDISNGEEVVNAEF